MIRTGDTETRLRTRRLAAGMAAPASVIALALAGLGAAPALAGTDCKNADAGIGDAKGQKLERSIKCMVNEQRTKRDQKSLGANAKLRKAAAKHNRVMVDEGCWAHTCPDEPSVNKRLRKVGYTDGAARWRYSQLFGCGATPLQTVDEWLATGQGKRKIRQRPGLRDIGVAARKQHVDSPENDCDAGDVTYTVLIAVRK